MSNENFYTQEVLGRHVVIIFEYEGTTKPYLGRVSQMKAELLDDKSGGIKTEHLVVFDDGDEIWFDLVEQEQLNTLTWINSAPKPQKLAIKAAPAQDTPHTAPPKKKRSAPSATKKKKTPQPVTKSQAVSAPNRRSRGLRRQLKSPERYNGSQYKNAREGLAKKHKVAGNVGGTPKRQNVGPTVSSNKKSLGKAQPQTAVAVTPRQEISEDWISEMDYWMRNVPHGPTKQKQTLGGTKADGLLNKVRSLTRGEGLVMPRWPKGVDFYEGVKVDLSFDFDTMLGEAKEYENVYGADNSEGSCLIRPLKKLQLFKEYWEGMAPRRTPRQPSVPTTTLVGPDGVSRDELAPVEAQPKVAAAAITPVACQEMSEDWIGEMDYWLRHVPHGKNNFLRTAGGSTAKAIMNKVQRLTRGEGLVMPRWPKGVIFYEGVKVDLSFDFDTMLTEASEYEKIYGTDNGSGSCLIQPLTKLQLFKQYWEETVPPKRTPPQHSKPANPVRPDGSEYDMASVAGGLSTVGRVCI